MPTNPNAMTTDFSRDVLGRYVCNGLDEAQRSADRNGSDTRPFDVIVIGGGSFGPILAQHLFAIDRTHRILVLEAGPFVLPEQVQNLPMLGLNQPSPPTTIAQLRNAGQFGPDKPRAEVWGLPWHSSTPFIGLAYCIGGRSLFWGGWSPRLLDPEEMPPERWPADVIAELNNPLPGGSESYFDQASEQLGVTETNDFIFGDLHEALRLRLFEGIDQVTGAIPLAELPSPPLDNIPPALQDLFKLEAPLAVQGRPPRSGFFPLNKFSSVPLLIKAARAAWNDSGGDDAKKRLMIVPRCHVNRLVTERLDGGMRRVTSVQTNLGEVPVPPGGVVIVALGTIESARLALNSFEGIPNYDQIGKNLVGHLRSNLAVRFPREALPPGLSQELQASALLLKGRHTHPDGTNGYFHLQITAAGLGELGGNAEAELFQMVPDIDAFDDLRRASDTHIVIHIRGIGEMLSDNPDSYVSPDNERDEAAFGSTRRAFVSIADPRDPAQRARNPRSAKDFALWQTMDAAANDVAQVLAGGHAVQVLSSTRDGLGTTHHEAGTLRMGDDPTTSVTDSDCRFHGVVNAYVAGPALFPTIGSPNPMLTSTALARRTADHLRFGSIPTDAFVPLFDGSTDNWRMSTIRDQPGRNDPGRFAIVDGSLESVPGNDIGLYWCTTPTPPNFILILEWLRGQENDNSGVFVRFPDPNGRGYNNTAYVGVDFGFEVQIDEAGAPDGADIHKTGAIYGQEEGQNLALRPARPPGQWNEFEIRVEDQTYTVLLNGVQVTQFDNPDPNRGLATTTDAASFVGLQSYPGSRVAFRNIHIRRL
jgi:choline dehydrogenase-like flavoprotein